MRTLLVLFLLAFSSLLHAQIRTVAGTGQKGFSGDGGLATSAQINNPFGLTRGPDGALYVCDTDNHRIRRIDAAGKITTVAGSGQRGYSGDGGPAIAAALNEPYEVRFDSKGNLLIVERLNHTVRRVDAATQKISTVAGTGTEGFSGDGGPATAATFKQPHSIALDAQDNLFICDILNHRLRRVDAKTGVVTTVSGTGEKKKPTDGGPFAGAPLSGPRAIMFDPKGTLWLALREGNAVYRLDFKTGTLHHVAGTGKSGFLGNDGPAKDATLAGPKGIDLDAAGNVYLADTESHSIRMIEVATGMLRVIAGTGKKGDGADGDPLACAMARPHGVFVDKDGTVYIGDSEAHKVRAVAARPGAGTK